MVLLVDLKKEGKKKFVVVMAEQSPRGETKEKRPSNTG